MNRVSTLELDVTSPSTKRTPMAFPVPEHLPRKTAAPQDVSSQILTKISEATPKSLTADLASSWVAELDTNILQTKVSYSMRML